MVRKHCWNVLFATVCTIQLTLGDVIRTVYCTHRCADYLQISESAMPACDGLQIREDKECETVISCELTDAVKERSQTNATTQGCCYHTTIKEPGDCNLRPPVRRPAKVTTVQSDKQSADNALFAQCSDASLPWLLAALFLLLLFIETVYLLWMLARFRQSGQKIGQCVEPSDRGQHVVVNVPRQTPLYDARPLLAETVPA